MGVIVPVGFGIVRILVGVNGSPDVDVMTIGYDGDVDEDPSVDASEVNVILKAAGRPFLPANYSSDYRYLGVECMRMTATGPITGTAVENIIGTKSAQAAPPNVAVLIQKNTARGGRKGKGRMFTPFMFTSRTNIDAGGVISSSDVTSIQSIWASAFTALAASDVKPALLHSDGSTPDLITSITVKSLVATQRRRLHR
jgi:hypothetical protein